MRPRLLVALSMSWIMFFLHPAWAQDAAAKPACALCPDRTIECPTCAGSGAKPMPCGFCNADGKLECDLCPAEEPGKLDCPNRYCRDGKSHWQGGDTDPCKLCATTGRIPCPSCRGRKPPACAACAGTGNRARTCPTCLGGKRVPCPLCTLDPARKGCSTCDGSAKAACQLCATVTTKGTEPCVHCNGTGDRHCTTCSGLDRVACAKCAATGKMRMGSSKYPGLPGIPLDKAGVKQCESCEGKATRNCHDCKKGRVDCKQCEKGRTQTVCAHCLQQRAIGCDECLSGGYSRWETLGDLLLAKDQPARAALFFDRALTTATKMTGPARLTQAHLQMLAMMSELEKLEQAKRAIETATGSPTAKRANPPNLAAAQLELFWPAYVQQRHWPDAPPEQRLAPWTNEPWMTAHRARVVARLEAALTRARAAAGK